MKNGVARSWGAIQKGFIAEVALEVDLVGRTG